MPSSTAVNYFTTSLLHYFTSSVMPTSSKRGIAYKCTKCDWTGERAYGQEHYAKVHATQMPFICRPCNYRAATEKQITSHQQQKRHAKKAGGNNEIVYTAGVNMGQWLRELSPEQSRLIWKERGTTPTPTVVASEPPVTSAPTVSTKPVKMTSTPTTPAELVELTPAPTAPAKQDQTAPVAEVLQATQVLDAINVRIEERQAIATLKQSAQPNRGVKRRNDEQKEDGSMKQQKGGPCPSQFSGLSCSSRSSSSEDDLAPQKSPAPSREELSQDEADFVPDYDETLGLTDTKDRALERIVKTSQWNSNPPPPQSCGATICCSHVSDVDDSPTCVDKPPPH